MNYLIDTHCHIQSIQNSLSELWLKDPTLTIADVIKRANKNRVKTLIAVGCNVADSRLAVNLAKNYPNIFASIGIHPHEADDFLKDVLLKAEFEKFLPDQNIKAIGECGLDYYYNISTKQAQLEVFKYQLVVAKKYNLPVIFHVRDAFDDFWSIIKQSMPLTGVIHSFTDSKKNLFKALDYGFKIGVNGIATFTKNIEQIEMYKSIPLDSLVVETDSPYLTPVPLRGRLNEPSNVLIITEFLATLRNESIEELIYQTTLSAMKLFKL